MHCAGESQHSCLAAHAATVVKTLKPMKKIIQHARQTWLALAVASLLAAPAFVQAASGEVTYQQECATCHIAFPPGMLPAASWQRLLAGMERHFGTNASLDMPTRKQLEGWLTAQAGSYRRVRNEPPRDRISLSDWFVRQHDEVPTVVWKRASIGSAANCAACHAKAARGDFNEHQVRIPK